LKQVQELNEKVTLVQTVVSYLLANFSNN